jgi:hypothetical protein
LLVAIHAATQQRRTMNHPFATMTEYRGGRPPVPQTTYAGGGIATPSVMTSSMASTFSNNDFFGAGSSRLGDASIGSKPQNEAVVISRATATAISAARSIILTGGTQSSAICTARAAAYSILSPSGAPKRTGFLARRKCKQQAQVIASMAVVSVTSALETPKMKPSNNMFTLNDPTVVFMDQARSSLSKGNTTESTTDDLSWHKDYTRSMADSHPPLEVPPAMQQQQHQQQQKQNLLQLKLFPTAGTAAAAMVAKGLAPASPTNSEKMADSSAFLTCETPTSCNVSQTSSIVTPFGYFRNKQVRDTQALPQLGRKMQLDIIESQDKSYESGEEEDGSSYSTATHDNSTLDDSRADTFSTMPTDCTDDRDDEEEEREEEEKRSRNSKDRKKSSRDDDSADDDSEKDRRRPIVPAQLQTSNLFFEEQILAALTELCTPSNQVAKSPPSSQRLIGNNETGKNRSFFEAAQRDDSTDGSLSDNTDDNGSSTLGSYDVAQNLGTEDEWDNNAKQYVPNNRTASKAKDKASDGIEQVVLRALASTILPKDGKGQQSVNDKVMSIETRSQPTSPRSEAKYTLPGTYIRNDLASSATAHSNNPQGGSRRQRSFSESRLDRTAVERRHRSPMSRSTLSPRRKHTHEPVGDSFWSSVSPTNFVSPRHNKSKHHNQQTSSATKMKKPTASGAWFNWNKKKNRKSNPEPAY